MFYIISFLVFDGVLLTTIILIARRADNIIAARTTERNKLEEKLKQLQMETGEHMKKLEALGGTITLCTSQDLTSRLLSLLFGGTTYTFSLILAGFLLGRPGHEGLIPAEWVKASVTPDAPHLMPGNDPGGCIVTMLLGVAGGLVGGFLGSQLGLGRVDGFDIRSLALAVGGSLLLLLFFRFMQKPKSV